MAGDEPSLEMRQQLGGLLRAARLRTGLSVRAAAKEAGVDRSTWTAAEEATRLPQKHKAAAMAAVVGWGPDSFDEVLADRSPKPPPTPPSREERQEEAHGFIVGLTRDELVRLADIYAEAFGEQAAEAFLLRAAEIRHAAAEADDQT